MILKCDLAGTCIPGRYRASRSVLPGYLLEVVLGVCGNSCSSRSTSSGGCINTGTNQVTIIVVATTDEVVGTVSSSSSNSSHSNSSSRSGCK